jgi:hypothetical protein
LNYDVRDEVSNIKPPSFIISNSQSGKYEVCGDTVTKPDGEKSYRAAS